MRGSNLYTEQMQYAETKCVNTSQHTFARCRMCVRERERILLRSIENMTIHVKIKITMKDYVD